MPILLIYALAGTAYGVAPWESLWTKLVVGGLVLIATTLLVFYMVILSRMARPDKK